MSQRGRPGLTSEQRREVWRRWTAGESAREISRALECKPGSIFHVVSSRGGMAPPERERAEQALTLAEREEISRGLARGVALRAIARQLRRSASTISREVTRNGGRAEYRAGTAEQRAWRQGLRPKPCLLATHPALRDAVAGKLQAHWSPQQVAGWLRVEHGGDTAMQVSHETIYKSLFVQARGVLKKELLACLRSRRLTRRPHAAAGRTDGRGQIVGAVSIRARPAEVEDRAVPGHWEGDLLSGTKDSHIATLVERQSRFVSLVRLDNRRSETVVDALVRHVQHLPQGLMRSLTWDRGKEMAQHARFKVATEVDVYFCDPHSPWQRGSNENTNGLLRQYLPKGADMSMYGQADLDAIAAELNARPRKTLCYRTPAATLAQAVAATT